ncbi:hypothetical protein V2A60_001087 [Cordyceps javanica]
MAKLQFWQRAPGRAVLFFTDVISATALIFEGYNQGVMGTVSSTPGFIEMSKIGSNGIVTNSVKQGGLIAAYYFGGMWGCFLGGWIGDKIGRKRGTLIGVVLGILGASLMSGSINSNMFLCARIVAGLGIAFINVIVLPWVSEVSESHDRGAKFSLIFIANFLGIVMAWLISKGRRQDCIRNLCKIRGDLSPDHPKIAAELKQLDATLAARYQKRGQFINLLLGGRYSGRLHLGRRAAMGCALQWIQQWTGILAIVGWAGELFSLAGFDAYKSLWLAGLANTLGIPGTAAAALVIDRVGRVKSLMISFITQGVALFLVAAFVKTSQDSAATDPVKSVQLGTAAASFVFVYIWFFTMFNIVPCWIYGTEIWPQEIRAKGYSFTIFGWAAGCGMTQFVIPIMLQNLGYKTYIFFGAMNIVAMPTVWFLYPEVAKRSLEEMNLLFTSDSLLVSENMKAYRQRIEDAGGDVAMASKHLLDEVQVRNMKA